MPNYTEDEIVAAIVAWLREVADDAEGQSLVFSGSQVRAIRVCSDMLEKHNAWKRHLPKNRAQA